MKTGNSQLGSKVVEAMTPNRCRARAAIPLLLFGALLCPVIAPQARAQDLLEDLRRVSAGPTCAVSTSGGAATPGSAQAAPAGDELMTLEQLQLPADAEHRAECRLPRAAERSGATQTAVRSETGGVAGAISAAEDAQRNLGLLAQVLDQDDTSGSRKSQAEELERSLAKSLETMAGAGSPDRSKRVAELRATLHRQLSEYFAASYGNLSYFSLAKYRGMWNRGDLKEAAQATLLLLDSELRACRTALGESSPRGRAVAAPVAIRFPRDLGKGLKAGELPLITLRAPSGKERKVRAFLDGDGYAVRLPPLEAGRWIAQPASGSAVSAEIGTASRGMVRVDPASPTTFTRADGRRFVPVGMNLAWLLEGNDQEKRLAAWTRYFDKMAATGQNWVRLWSCPWGLALESKKTGAGRYDVAAFESMGNILKLAAERGIYVQVVIEYHGMLKPKNDWPNNPYNLANGGPCKKPGEFFSSAAARQLFKRRLDQLVAHFAGFENLFAWELWNEVDLTLCNPVSVLGWHKEMAAYLKQIDPFGHMVTTSTAGATVLYAPLWMQGHLDFAQVHCYQHNLADSLPGELDSVDHYGKPYLAGEAGQDSAWEPYIWETKFDPQAIGLHDALFAGLSCGSAGTGMFWWWDTYIEPSNHYGVFAPASRLATWLESMSGKVDRASLLIMGGGAVRGHAVRSATRALVWLKDRDYVPTEKVTTPTAAERGPCTVVVGVPENGTWTVTRFDTWTGLQTSEGTAESRSKLLRFKTGTFRKDVAYLFERK